MQRKTCCESFVYFSENILQLRKMYGYSKQQMASILRVSPWMLGKIEQGILPPRLSVDILFAVQEHFGISPSKQLSQNLADCICQPPAIKSKKQQSVRFY